MRMNWRVVVKVTAMTTMVAVLGVGTAAAAKTSRHIHGGSSPSIGAFGTVTSVNEMNAAGTCGTTGAGGDFTLTAWKNATTYKVDVSTSTTFVDPAVSTPSFADVCVGGLVGALGTVSGDTVTATTVYLAPLQTPPKPHGVFGTVASVNGSNGTGSCGTADAAGDFTLTAWKNTIAYTVDVSASTRFRELGATKPSFADVCVGDVVGAVGTISGDTVNATTVYVAPTLTTPPPIQPTGVLGTVASVNGSNATGTCGVADTAGVFTLTALTAVPVTSIVPPSTTTTYTVQVSTSTTFVHPGVVTPSFANVCVGHLVSAVGTISGDTVNATTVYVTPISVVGNVVSANRSHAAHRARHGRKH